MILLTSPLKSTEDMTHGYLASNCVCLTETVNHFGDSCLSLK